MMLRLFLRILCCFLQFPLLILFALVDWLQIASYLFRRDSQPSPTAARSGRCSIVVLNWNGRHLLEESIPPVLKAVKQSGIHHQVIVTDNGSTDDSVEWLRKSFPQVEVLELPQNLGFGVGNNRGVQAAKHEIVVLLNNDMLVSEDFLEPLLQGFSDPTVFAVTSQILFPEGKPREETGNTHMGIRLGYPHLSHEALKPYHFSRSRLPVLWAGGGSSAFHREKFLQLGGFSDLFSPCYLEDTDLSYRAWRRGWKVLFAPESKVLHRHRSSSLVRFSSKKLDSLIEERKLWYLWKNFQLRTLLSHFLLFPFSVTKWISFPLYLRALRRIPRVLLSRCGEPRRRVSDQEIRTWIDHPLSYLNHFDPGRRDVSRVQFGRLKILIVSAYLPHLGTHGGGGRVFQLLKQASREFEMSLITFVEPLREESFLAQVRPLCRRVETVPRGRFDPLSYFPYEPFEEFNLTIFRRRLEDILTEEDFDLIHFEWTQMALYADLVPHIPKILTEIEVNYAAHRTLLTVEPNVFKKVRKFYNTLQTLYREVEMCRKVDRVICVTIEDKEYLRGYVPEEKLTVINTGVDIEYFHYVAQPSEPNSIVFVGAFRHFPNVDAMDYFCREVFPRILESLPDTHFYIVGSSPPLSIQKLGQHPNITVTGFVEDIRDYYRAAQVVVVPLRTGVGIRGKILEAWSCGKATVASSLACQGIHAFHGENVLIADNPEEFAMWTVALLRHPDFCQELGARGRRMAGDFYDWRILGRQLSRFYKDVAGLEIEEAVANQETQDQRSN